VPCPYLIGDVDLAGHSPVHQGLEQVFQRGATRLLALLGYALLPNNTFSNLSA